MRFEVYPIKGVSIGQLGKSNRSPEETAAEIRAKYEEVASQMGTIIAGYELTTKVAPTPGRDGEGRQSMDRNFTGESVLFLVAKFPESTE